ncbi:spore coat protein U domain-containing protein [Phyllobacterium sp. NPDC097923]|uniref:spore coat protein U domain-containing protein n=1 Tax=Phyllobacterium sp. NPDC097923 TaxID=3364404 RepID=UPI00383B92E3
MKIVIPILAMSALIASTGVGWSVEPVTDSLGIKIEFKRECKVDPGAEGLLLDFGRHLTLANLAEIEQIDAEATIKVQCSSGVDYVIYINNGKYPSAESLSLSSARKMSNDKGAFINYQVYSDVYRKTIVGTKGMPRFKNAAYEAMEKILRREGPAMVLADLPGIYGGFSYGDIEECKVFGRILKPKGGFRDLPTGTYSDTLSVTVSF